MNKRVFFFFLLGFICSSVHAQRSTPTQLQIENLYSGEAIDAYDLRPRTMEGSLYFREEQLPAAVQLNNGKVLNGVPARYNLENNVLELFTDKGIFELSGARVREFTLEAGSTAGDVTQRYRFVNRDRFGVGEELEEIDFLYYLLEDRYSLLGAYEVTILKPNYVPALDAGSLSSQAVQKERFFFYDGKQFRAIPNRRKRAAELLKPLDEGVEKYLKETRTDLNDADDLRRLFQWLNREK